MNYQLTKPWRKSEKKMKITQKQLIMLYQILIGSCPIVNDMVFSQAQRQKLADDILNQQDNETLLEIRS